MHGPGGCMVPGGVHGSRGCMVQGECMVGGVCMVPGVPCGDPPQMATAAGGTHPT